MTPMTDSIAENIQQVRDTIADACARAGRDPDEITLVAVSKRKPVTAVLEALRAGVQHFGENRVKESREKIPVVMNNLKDLPEPTWHMVGHIQSRKAKNVLPLFSVTHSLDSVSLARKLNTIATDKDERPQVFIQVNIAGEDQKYGFQGENWETDAHVREALMSQIEQVLQLNALDVRGLMTMAPYGAPEDELRAVFASLASLKATLEDRFDVILPDLSMGMTDDYPIAIEEGATVIRVGRAIFGERTY